MDKLHDYWDAFNEIVPTKWNPQTFNKIQSIIQKILNRNVMLKPNPFTMPGIKVLVNDNEKNMMLEALGLNLYDRNSDLPNAKDMVKNCKFFTSIMKIKGSFERLAFFAPMVCYAAQLYSLNRKKECRTIFFILSFVAYSGAIESSFYSVKVGSGVKAFHNTLINFDVMSTVMEKEMSKKSDIKSNTIPEILFNKMDVSINNYAVKNKYLTTFPITDKKLNIIITAGIISRIRSMVSDIAEKYYALLNAMKDDDGSARVYKYSPSSMVGRDDSGADEIVGVDYRSNAQIIEQVVINAMTQLVRPDPKIADMAVNINFGLVISNPDEQLRVNKRVNMAKKVEGIVANILDKHQKLIPKMLRAILQVYIFDWKSEKTTSLKLDDPAFLKRAMRTFNNNRLNPNVTIIKKCMSSFLNGSEDEEIGDKINGSVYYINGGKSQRNNIKKYVYNYFCIVLFNELKYV